MPLCPMPAKFIEGGNPLFRFCEVDKERLASKYPRLVFTPIAGELEGGVHDAAGKP